MADEKTPQAEGDEKLDNLVKKRKSKARLPIIIITSIVLVIAIVVGGVLWYIDDMLDLIQYEGESGMYDDESSIDIDDPQFNEEDEYSIDESFVDPEASGSPLEDSLDVSEDTSNGGTTGNPGGKDENGITDWNYDKYEPDQSILEGIFDGVAPEYKAEVTNILLIGCDTSGGKGSRSDTMILMSINNVKKRIVLTSILRDCYVAIDGYQNNRINAAHAAGGPSLLMQTIKKNFGVDVDYYVRVSFSSFKGAVDAMGGVDITVNDVNYNWFSVYKEHELTGLTKAQACDGTHVIHLTGHEALSYARNRSYANGDLTRTLHQRDLLMQVMQNFRDSSITEIHNVLSTVLPYIKTDMPKNVLKSHVWNSPDYLQYNIVSHRIPDGKVGFKFERIRNMSVITLPVEANAAKLKTVIYD